MTTTTNLHEPTLESLTKTVLEAPAVLDAIASSPRHKVASTAVRAAVRATVLLLASRPSITRALWNGHWPHVTGAGH